MLTHIKLCIMKYEKTYFFVIIKPGDVSGRKWIGRLTLHWNRISRVILDTIQMNSRDIFVKRCNNDIH